MSLRTYKPTSPSQRSRISVVYDYLWKKRPFKLLVSGLHKTGGRNNDGHITCRHVGGGHKRLYRIIDFKRQKDNTKATVQRIEYDPNRSSHIALVKYEDNTYNYIIAPDKLRENDIVESGEKVDIKDGNSLEIGNIPVGTTIHNIEMKIGKGAQICRSAGTSAQVIGRHVNDYTQIRLASGEIRLIHNRCRATIGIVSNLDHKNTKFGKAGRKRWLGVRPTVRGVAMNPIDHPHGGGEGKTSGGRHPVTPWGVPTLGKKTRKKNKQSNKFILRQRKRGR